MSNFELLTKEEACRDCELVDEGQVVLCPSHAVAEIAKVVDEMQAEASERADDLMELSERIEELRVRLDEIARERS